MVDAYRTTALTRHVLAKHCPGNKSTGIAKHRYRFALRSVLIK